MTSYQQRQKMEAEGLAIYVELVTKMAARGLTPPKLTRPTDTQLFRRMMAQIKEHDDKR